MSLRKAARAKSATSKRASRVSVQEQFVTNQAALTQGPQIRKTFHVKDLVRVSPMTDHQHEVFDLWEQPGVECLVLKGCAGSGKTFQSLYLALKEVLATDTEYDKIVIIRSTAAVRSSGFLPGTLEEKLAPYEDPYSGILDELFPWKRSYEHLKLLKKIEFHSTEFLRGVTLDRCIVIVDESQNMTLAELKTIVTRKGPNCKLVFCGDTYQNDLIVKKNDQSGFEEFCAILAHMSEVGIVEFDVDDIVRSGFVRSFIIQAQKLGL